MNFKEYFENSLNEGSTEKLIVIPSNEKDIKKIQKILDNSDFSGEFDNRFKQWSFDEENPNALEKELDKIFIKNNIDVTFELE